MSADPPALVTLEDPAAPVEDLMSRVSSALAGRFQMFGELGRGGDGTVAALGRDAVSQTLVAIRIRPLSDRPRTYQVDVLRRLDGSLPTLTETCPSCSQILQSWTPFCPFCAADLSRVAVSRSGRSREEILDLVRRASAGRYDVIGEVDRPGGGGLVYLGKDVRTGELVAMRLMETTGTADRRSGAERRSGTDRRDAERRTRPERVPEERRGSAKPKYTLDLTELVNPLADGSA